MILHIADDEKFLDHSITVFETVHTGRNIYLVNSNTALVHIKSRHENIICYKYGSKEYAKIINDQRNVSAVIFHDLIHDYKWKLAVEFSTDTHIHWMCYGSELYNIPYLRNTLYLPLTKDAIRNKNKGSLKERIEDRYPLLYNSVYESLKNDSTQFIHFKKAVQRCNSFSSPIADELIYVKKHLNPKINFIPFHHITLEHLTSHVKDLVCTDQDFLVGNSANPSCNHLDTFAQLKEIESTKSVYVPLSYPKNEQYIKIVESYGNKIFKSQFKPLTEFLSMSEYSNILKSCGNVVMNFNRQQGIANIVLALYLGAKVYINDTNISYNYLKEKGLTFFHINQLSEVYEMDNNVELAKKNRPILENMYSEQVVIDIARHLVGTLDN